MAAPQFDCAEVLRGLNLLYPQEHGVIELVVLQKGKLPLLSCRSDNRELLVDEIAIYDGQEDTVAIYTSLNRLDPATFEQQGLNVDKPLSPGPRVNSSNVARVAGILFDIDPFRTSGNKKDSTTDSEHQAAIEAADFLKHKLAFMGWPEPVVGSSGNGAALRYICDLPASKETTDLLSRALRAANAMLPPELAAQVEVDPATFDLPRISKVFGTMTRKGPGTEERPHRRAAIISAPEKLEPVGIDCIIKLAAMWKQQEDAPHKPRGEHAEKAEPLSSDAAERLQALFTAEPSFKGKLFTPAPNGNRSTHECHLCSRLWESAFSEAEIYAVMTSSPQTKWHERNETYRRSTIEAGIRQAEANHAEKMEREAERGIDCEELTEGGNAARLERIHGDDLRYNHTHKKWYLWDNGRWKVDANGGAIRKAGDVVASLYMAAARAGSHDAREKLTLHAWVTDSRKGLNNMLALAANRLKFALTADDFDQDAWLLGAENVTIDLKTGSPREPRRGDLITKTIGARYDRAAQCPQWLRFLERIFPDEALREYIKRASGYCLSGSMVEQIFFFCYGQGANGKSVFLALLRALLGEYARQADFSTFLVQRTEKVRNDLAALADVRIITAIEAEEGGRLSMQVVKAWTGGDPITARFLFAENFTFRPVGKIWLAANNKPTISERNHAAWRRVRLIPFTVTIPPEEQDRELEAKLIEELPGILNWALEGLQDYRKSGMQTPPAVLEATNEYRRENDSLEQFIFECCEIGNLKVCKNTELYDTYLSFCGMSGLKALSQTKFSIELKTREGISSTKSKHGVEWKGIALEAKWVMGLSNPSPQAGDAKGDGLGQNAQSSENRPTRGDFAQSGVNPSPHSDCNPSPIKKDPFYADGRAGEGDGQKAPKHNKNSNEEERPTHGDTMKSVRFVTDYDSDIDGEMRHLRPGDVVDVSSSRAETWIKRGVAEAVT